MLKVLYVNKKGLDFDIFVAADTVPCASKTVINQTFLFFSFFFFPKVGRFEVNLISPDTKSVVLEKNFKDISSCSQVSINKKQCIDYQKKMN